MIGSAGHHEHQDPTVPRGALIGIAALLAVTMALTGAVSFGLLPREADPQASRAAQQIAPAQQRSLQFADAADGSVIVTDADTGSTVATIGFGQGGFVRATMRRLVKARTAAGIGSETPFTLTRWANGALSLQDPATGKQAEIYGYGADHVAAFAAMLEGPAA